MALCLNFGYLWAFLNALQLLDVVSLEASRFASSAKPNGALGNVVLSRLFTSVPL